MQHSLRQIDGPRRVQDIVDTWQQIEVNGKTRHIIYLGEDTRVIRVVKKIVRGLSHHHNVMTAVPESRVWADVMKYRLPADLFAQMAYAHREPDVVEYRYSVIEEVGIQSAWLGEKRGHILNYELFRGN